MKKQVTIEDVQRAWGNLPETVRVRFCKAILQLKPSYFKVWADEAGIRAGFRIEKLAERKHQPEQLDRTLFAIGGGDFARQCIITFFDNCQKKINELYCRKKAIGESTERAEEAIRTLYTEFPSEQPLVQFYETSLRWIYPDLAQSGHRQQCQVNNVTKKTAAHSQLIETQTIMAADVRHDSLDLAGTKAQLTTDQEQRSMNVEVAKDHNRAAPSSECQHACSVGMAEELRKTLDTLKAALKSYDDWCVRVRPSTMCIGDAQQFAANIMPGLMNIVEDISSSVIALTTLLSRLSCLLPCNQCDSAIVCHVRHLELAVLGDSRATIQNTMSKAEEVCAALMQQNAITEKITKDIEVAKRRVQELSRQLGDSTTTETPVGHLLSTRDAHTCLEEVKERERNLGDKYEDKVRNRILQCRETVSRIESECDVARISDADRQQLDALRNRIEGANNIRDIDEISQNITLLYSRLLNDPLTINLCRIAQHILGERLYGQELLHMVDLLIARDQCAVALTLLTTLQQAIAVEQLHSDLLDDYISHLLRAAAMTAKHLNMPREWASDVLRMPWIAQLTARDIGDTVKLRIAGVIIGSVIPEGNCVYQDVVARFRIIEALDKRNLLHLKEYLERRVLHGEQVCLSKEDAMAESSHRAEHIDAYFEKDGAWFKHQQCRNARHYGHMEMREVFPRLLELRDRVYHLCKSGDVNTARATIRSTSERDLYKRCAKAANLKNEEHPRYMPKIVAFIAEVRSALSRYVEAYEQGLHRSIRQIDVKKVKSDIQDVRVQDSAFEAVWQFIMSSVDQDSTEVHEVMQFDLLGIVLQSDTAAISVAPHIVKKYCAMPRVCMDEEDLRMLLENIERCPSVSDTISYLERHDCWLQAALMVSDDDKRRRELTRRGDEKARELMNRYLEVAGEADKEYANQIREVLKSGRYGVAATIVAAVEKAFARQKETQLSQSFQQCEADLRKLATLKEHIWENTDSSTRWSTLYDAICMAEKEVQWVKATLRKSKSVTDGSYPQRLIDLIAVIKHVVESDLQDVSELRQNLATYQEANAYSSEALPAVPPVTRPEYEDLMRYWAWLKNEAGKTDSDAQSAASPWFKFCHSFADACRLTRSYLKYQTLTEHRVKIGTYRTTFAKRRSEFFRKEVYLYVLPGENPSQDEIRSLTRFLRHEDCLSALHIVFAPGACDTIRPEFQQSALLHVTFVTSETLHSLLSRKEPGTALRHMMLTGEQLNSASPFVSNNAVSGNADLFVGRTKYIDRIITTKEQIAIVGGRRIGKSSVLLAAKHALEKHDWRVAFTDLQLHVSDSGNNIDLALCQDICHALGVSPVSDYVEFRCALSQMLSNGHKIAVIIDECDLYLIKRQECSDNSRYPLISFLRSISGEHAGKLKIVLAGFKRLHHALTLKSDEAHYPFSNFLQELRLEGLTSDEGHELIKTGFADMGIDLNPGVERMICDKATTHPCFIQHFCKLLVAHIAQRHSTELLEITVDDVTAVYEGCSRREPSDFVKFVDDTLGMNLSNLGRAMILILAVTVIGKDGDPARSLSRSDILDSTNQWFNLARIEKPAVADVDLALSFLCMSGILKEIRQGDHGYRLGYPNYVDILDRLEETDRDVIERCIKEYDEKERGRIA